MRQRGEAFWGWANADLHHRTHDETLENGVHIDVQVRLSIKGITQLFIGVYSPTGEAISEQAYEACHGESMTRAMARGVASARVIALGWPALPVNPALSGAERVIK